MTFYLKIMKTYYRIISKVAPKLGGKMAFRLFEKVRKKDIRKREEQFYEKARHFKVPFLQQDVHCYELGDVKGDLVFLVHGWDSNSGSLSKFAFELADRNYRVVSFDLPGHAHASSSRTNLYECKEAFHSLIKFINPQEPFTVIAHSFGSAVATYAISKLNYKIDKFVFLTTPNSLLDVFTDFKNFIGITDESFSYMIQNAEKLVQEDIKSVNVSERLKNISFTKLLLVHDKNDRIISFKNSESVYSANHKNSELKAYTNIGHYRMLWNEEVIEDTLSFVTAN
jgi:pimeloyl-ACP methyl ester carboxylesterase